MPQHLWENILDFRFYEVRDAGQASDGGRWEPERSPICLGDRCGPFTETIDPEGGRTLDLRA